jgi:prophage endopeptidase
VNLLISILIGIVCTIGSYYYGHYEGDKDGYARRDTETAIQIAKLNAENQQKTNSLVQQVADKDVELQKEKANAKKEIAKRDADIASGKLRLYIHTKTPTNCPSTNAPTAVGHNANDAELDTETSRALVAITDTGDSAIRKLNACVAVYNQVREMINGSPTTK